MSVDGQLESQMLKNANAYTQGSANRTLTKFLDQRDPYSTASDAVISIQINSVNPNIGGSPNTTQIIWTEIAKDPKNSEVLSKKTYTGQFTFTQAQKPSLAPEIYLYNPFGFYITDISWTQNYDTYEA